jgi:tetratricopeptide (TPR) repeat protein
MNWEEIVLRGIKNREDISKVLDRAAKVAPEEIREILEKLPETIDLNEDYIKDLEREGGSVLVLLYYYWLSLCSESYHVFPPGMQKLILENGLKASLGALRCASKLNEKEIEAGFLFRAGGALYDLRRFSQAENAFIKALTLYRNLAEDSFDSCNLHVAKVLNNMGNLYCKVEKLSDAERAYKEALTIYRNFAKENPGYTPDVAMTMHNLGNCYRHMRKFAEAEKAYIQALTEFTALAKKNPDVYALNMVVALNNLGILYWTTNRFSEAEKAYTEVLTELESLVRENPDTYNAYLAMTLSNIGNFYSGTGDFKKGEKAHKRALRIRKELAKENPDTYNLDVAMTLSNLGNFYSGIGDFKKGEKYCLEALKIINGLPEEDFNSYYSCKANTFNNLGNVYLDMNDFSRAEEALTEALKIYRQLAEENPGYTPDVAMTLNNLGTLHRHTDKFSEAEKAYTEILTIYRQLAEENPGVYTPDVAMTLNNIGIVYWSVNDFPQAEKAYTEALTLYEELSKEYPDVYILQVARTLDNLGSLYQHTHQYSRAEEAFLRTLAEFRKLTKKNPEYMSDVAMTLNNLGVLYWSTSDFPQAEKAYTEALTEFRQLAEENPGAYIPAVAMVLTNVGALHSEDGDFQNAEEAYTEALTLYRQLAEENPDVYDSDVAMTLNNLGVTYRCTGNMEKAEETLNEALEKYEQLARENPDAYDRYVITALNSLGALCSHTMNIEKAEILLTEALTRAEERALWFELAESYDTLSHVMPDKKEDAVRALELGILVSGEEKYKYAQKGRRENLYSGLLEHTDNPQKGIGILETLRDPDLLSLKWDMEKIEQAKDNKGLQRKIVEEVLKKKISPQIPHFKMLDNALFLYIQILEGSILYFAVTRGGMRLFRGTKTFVDVGRKLLVNLRVQALGVLHGKDIHGIMRKFNKYLAEWTCTLPSQIQELFSEKDVIIFSPDAAISYFPLEGLLIDDEPICLSKKVIRATSMHQLQGRTPPKLVVDSSLLVGNPWPSIDEDYIRYPHPRRIEISYLKNAEKEVEVLAGKLPDPKILLDTSATAETFLKELSNHSIVHFAGHGHVGRILLFSGPMTKYPPEFEPEEFAELRKAWRVINDTTVYMMDEWDMVTDIDILNTPLKRGAFVFLSACETGQHKYAGGGHFQGLAQAFLKRGASNVISSLVPLHGAPAKDFAVSFYDMLLSQKPVSTALQDTRKKIRERYKAHIHWLPYIHYGYL